MAKEEILIDLKVDADESTESINSLRAAVREMTKARNDANLTTAEGRATVQSLNQAIDANNAKIKSNIDSLTKQRMNVGNYKKDIQDAIPALDQFTGGAVSAGQGIMTMTKQALAFIATPLGAVIAAVGLAVAALTAYFKGSEEGQDRLAKITAVLNVGMNKLMVAFETVGEAVYNAVTGVGSMTDKLGIFVVALDIALTPLKLLYEGLKLISDVSGFTKVVEDTVKAGESIADLYDQIEARENELVVLRAETSAKVLELREKAITQEGEAKRKTVQQAIDLEKALAAEEKKNLDDKLRAFDLEAAATGALTEEQKAKRAELVAAIINAESQGAQATIKFQKEIERLRDEENVKKDEARQRDLLDEEFKAAVQQRDLERLQQKIDATTENNEEIIALNEQLNIQLEAESVEMDARQEAELQKSIERGRRSVELTRMTEQQKLGFVSQSLNLASGLLDRKSAEYKALAVTQGLINTYAGASAAVAPPPVGAGPVFGPILAALTIASGLVNVGKIAGFANGGLIKMGAGLPIQRSNGDNILATVKTGEVILNQRQQSALGGSRTFSAIGVPGFADGGVVGFPSSAIDSSTNIGFDLSRLESFISNLKVQVAVEDINDGQKNYAEITDRAQF